MIRTFAGSAIFVACMAVAWGSWSFFLSIPHAILSLSALTAPFILPRDRTSALKYGKKQGETKLKFLILALLSTVGVGFLLPFFAGRQMGGIAVSERIRYMGVAIFLSGYAIRVLATRKLKKQFSFLVIIQENHQLITSGIYSMIRHPVYLGTILAVFGMFLVFPTWYGLIFVVFYTSLLAYRISLEEKLLLKTFGSVFEEYSTKSFRLIPHIY
ncbi:MAG TPA: isoprenylcysteine carboxylmethyltransferase family protein [Acidobacteriota bacterium]|nr:isoprenylcysteine carboxylmethyltransferase family protein [Acidobacteriota bacterium]